MKELIIDCNPYFVRAALVDDGELTTFGIEHVAMRGHVGNVYKGKVENVLAGMRAAFVNVGLERNGFLYIGDEDEGGGRKISPGDEVMCQVVKEQIGTKGVRLTADITLPGYNLVLLPTGGFRGVSRKIESDERRAYLESLVASVCPQNMGFIVRSAAIKTRDEEILAEVDYLIGIWRKIESDYAKSPATSVVFREAQLLERIIRDNYAENVERIVINEKSLAERLSSRMKNVRVEYYDGARSVFRQYGLADQIDRLADRKVMLDNGASIVIDRTEALTVIDVNTARYVGTKDLEDTVFKTNLAAAVQVARQLRVRNIGGIVIIDFIDMQEEEHRRAVVDKLREELKKDRMKTSAVAMTGLGLVELTRKRTRPSADAFMLEPCDACGGGFVVSSVHLAFKLRDQMIEYTLANQFDSLVVRAYPCVCERAFEDRVMAREAAGIWHGKRVYLIPDPTLSREKFVMEGRNEKVLTLPADARLLY